MHELIAEVNALATGWATWILALSWQVAAFAAVVYALTRLLHGATPTVRLQLWSLVFLRLLLPPSLGTPWSIGTLATCLHRTAAEPLPVLAAPAPPPARDGMSLATAAPDRLRTDPERPGRGAAPAPATPPVTMSNVSTPAGAPEPSASRASIAGAKPHDPGFSLTIRSCLMLGWVLSVVALALVAVRQHRRLARAVRRERTPLSAETDRTARALALRLGIRRRIDIQATSLLRSPALFGLLRPAILVPAGWEQATRPRDRLHIIAHELAHLKRRDACFGLAETLGCITFWFHPVLWWAGRNVRREREMACDRIAVACTDAEPDAYARTLVRVAEGLGRGAALAPGRIGVFESPNELLGRVRAVRRGHRSSRLGAALAGACYLAALLLLPMAALSGAAGEPQGAATAASGEGEGPHPAPAVARPPEPEPTVVRGRVAELESEQPIAGATLTIRDWEDGPEQRAETRSGADGRFEIAALPGNSRLFVFADGYAAMYRTADVREGVNRGWDFLLPRSARVSGRVLDTDGRPQAGRVIELWNEGGAPPPAPGTDYYATGGQGNDMTDAEGQFDMPNVAPGRHRIIVYLPSPIGGDRCMEQVPVNTQLLRVSSGDQVQAFEIVVRPPEDSTLAGHVRDARGAPMPGIVVDTFIPHGRHWWTKTDAAGAYQLAGLDGIGRSRLIVHFNGIDGADGYTLHIPDVPINAANVNLTVPGKGTIRGAVRDGKTGATVTDYAVSVPVLRLLDSGAVWPSPQVDITRGENGGFTIAGVPAGEVTVEVRAQGCGCQRFVTTVTAGFDTALACDMLGPAVLEGRTTLNGEPKGVSIIINGEWLGSNESGNYRFDQFPNGDHTVWFFLADGWHRSVDLRLTSGQTTRADVEMGGSCEVAGTVTLPEDETYCEVRLAARPAPDGWTGGRPDPAEHVLTYALIQRSGQPYRLTHIPPGRYYLMAGLSRPSMHRFLLADSRELELGDNEQKTVNFDLTALAGTSRLGLPASVPP